MIIRSSQAHLHDLLPSLSSVLVEQLVCHHHHHHQTFHRTLDKRNRYKKQCTECAEMWTKRNSYYYENVGVTCKIHVDQRSVISVVSLKAFSHECRLRTSTGQRTGLHWATETDSDPHSTSRSTCAQCNDSYTTLFPICIACATIALIQ